MPSTYIHFWVTASLAGDASATADDAEAAFFFGTAVPDVGLVGGPRREATHFWAPGDDAGGRVGAARLLAAHPHLAAARLNAVERAFVAGYLCHLATDEYWIRAIFERFFGPKTPYAAGPEGLALQQALYTVVERRRGELGTALEPAVNALARAATLSLREDLPPFATIAEQQRFLEAQLAFTTLPPGVERYRHWQRVRTRPPPAGQDDASFLDRLPALEAQAAALVPDQVIEHFHHQAVPACRLLLQDYLASRPLGG